MESLIESMRNGDVSAEPTLVLSSSESSPALGRARALGVPTATFESDQQLMAHLEGIDWLCLAGYMKLLPEAVIRQMGGRVLNIHPALLPKFGGKNMYGIRVHEAVIAAGETESGCTVHFVSPEYDEGEVVLQLRCPVLPEDTAIELADRVLKLEHQAYPLALAKVIREA